MTTVFIILVGIVGGFLGAWLAYTLIVSKERAERKKLVKEIAEAEKRIEGESKNCCPNPIGHLVETVNLILDHLGLEVEGGNRLVETGKKK